MKTFVKVLCKMKDGNIKAIEKELPEELVQVEAIIIEKYNAFWTDRWKEIDGFGVNLK